MALLGAASHCQVSGLAAALGLKRPSSIATASASQDPGANLDDMTFFGDDKTALLTQVYLFVALVSFFSSKFLQLQSYSVASICAAIASEEPSSTPSWAFLGFVKEGRESGTVLDLHRELEGGPLGPPLALVPIMDHPPGQNLSMTRWQPRT